MSGGEQALTATALIFAVFLANPSPGLRAGRGGRAAGRRQRRPLLPPACTRCARRTDTRFLAITHNPVTMSRMDRLFGVTMMPSGACRQLVSVDLHAGGRRIAAE